MIIIKKVIWIGTGVILILIFILSFSTIKKQLAMKQIQEVQKQEQVEHEEVTNEQEEEPENDPDETAKSDDPVKDFLSEKVEKTMKLFFKNDIQIVSIGDSLTEGVGDEMKNGGYVGILSDTINQDKQLVDIQNFGKRGNRSDQLIARMKEPEIEGALADADIILITIGANDIMQIFKENFTDLTLDKFATGKIKYENRLDYILTTMEENNPNAAIYLIGFYNPFKKYFVDIEELELIIESWNGIGKEVTEQHDHVSYIPVKDLFEDTTINYFSEDNFHPNHLGYELIAERVLEYITSKGEGDEQPE